MECSTILMLFVYSFFFLRVVLHCSRMQVGGVVGRYSRCAGASGCRAANGGGEICVCSYATVSEWGWIVNNHPYLSSRGGKTSYRMWKKKEIYVYLYKEYKYCDSDPDHVDFRKKGIKREIHAIREALTYAARTLTE